MAANTVSKVDPSFNVFHLVEAEARHQKEMREADTRRQDDLRAAETLRLDEELEIRVDYGKQISDIRADCAKEVSVAEKNRLDAIHVATTLATSATAKQAAELAATLAAQVATSAEALRTLVATTAAAQAAASAQTTAETSKRLGALEKAQYENQGAGVPTEIANRIALLEQRGDKGEGASSVSTPLIAALAAGAGGFLIFVIEKMFN